MATLEKIRSKSVLLFVIIIVALLAFILGDFLTSGRTYFGSGSTVAKAGKAKVEYTDYQARMNVESERRNQNTADDNMETVIDELLMEKMLQREYDELGITVTETELTEAMTGANPDPIAQRLYYTLAQQTQGLIPPTSQGVYDAMMNPQKYNLPQEFGDQLRQAWSSTEKNVEENIKSRKLQRLINGLYGANDLDAREMFNDVTTTRHFAYAAKPISDVPDSDVKVTDDDLRDAWTKNKEYYRLNEPMRAIDYIMVTIEPSQQDRAAATMEIEAALAALNSTEGTSAVTSNPKFVVNNSTATSSMIRDNDLKQFVDSASVGEARILSHEGDNFVLVKMLSSTMDIDSLNYSVMARADEAPVDSLFAAINAGKSFGELADNVTVLAQDSVWTSMYGASDKLKELFVEATPGKAIMVTDTIEGLPTPAIIRVNERRAPVPFYEFAIMEYSVDPSQETLSKLSNDLRTFISSNSTAEDFSKNAADAGYTLISAVVQPSGSHSDRVVKNFARLPQFNVRDARPAVKWMMNAKKGQVMPIYQDSRQSYLLTAAVKEAYDGDYLPYTAVVLKDHLTEKAMHDKKAAKLVEQYKGKANDVAGYATAMGVQPQETDIMFGSSSSFIPGVGPAFSESEIVGAIGAAKPGQLSDIVAGENAVIVFNVTGDENNDQKYDAKEHFAQYSNDFNQKFGINTVSDARGAMFLLFQGKNKMENNGLNFIQGHGE